MTARFSRHARDHLVHIRAYIAAQRPFSAELARGRILESIRSLQEVPWLGRPGQKQGTRELGVVSGYGPIVRVLRRPEKE